MSAPYLFISYSREDTALQQKVIRELRERGINVWVDIENLIPGTPAWEREVERSIRGASGVIVLLSPGSNNSEWVRREVSFAEENDKRIFPVLIRGDENDSIPLRLSSHQRVDLRRNFNKGMDYLADTLNDFLGTTVISKRKKEEKKSFDLSSIDFKKFAIPGAIALFGLTCLGGLAFAVNAIINGTKTPVPATTPPDVDPAITETATKPVTAQDEPTGRIIYTCQVQGDEICIINADGSNWRRLTDTSLASFNANPSPDGESAVYVVSDGETSEIYELNINTGKSMQLTNLERSLGSPEISPDNKFIIFHYPIGNNRVNNLQLWIMNRDGSDPHEFYSEPGRDVHDGTWSPDGTQVLFALGRGENNKLYVIDFNGREPKLLNASIDTRGRSDWSVNDLISLDMGGAWAHEVYLMNADGSNLEQVSPGGLNAQGASISPDGKWITFSGYTNVAGKDLASCEIYIMRVDGSDLRRLTNNGYCDYQPRWGK
ncbi:MAG: hypothetical protein C3F07_19950 [Anaerolineales bacterium]|nr:TIR domain-containing protein [Anaerolineae bacterium]PWB69242.1 MAG: hypothetical protein C3F07_19950 [Anaerolineales bacterium]